jgi:hypothetical protein
MLGSIARRSVVLSSRRSATKTRELRNLRRASRGTSSISARTPTRSVSVSHPTLGGLTERVERVVDTLDDAQGGPATPHHTAMTGGTDLPQRLRGARGRGGEHQHGGGGRLGTSGRSSPSPPVTPVFPVPPSPAAASASRRAGAQSHPTARVSSASRRLALATVCTRQEAMRASGAPRGRPAGVMPIADRMATAWAFRDRSRLLVMAITFFV